MGWGLAAAAGIGALSSLFGGKGGKTQQLANLSPEQTQFLQQLLGSLNGQNLDLGSDELYGEGSDQIMKMLQGDTSLIEAPLMAQYQNEILPGIAQRFGGLGAQSSSGYQNALAGAGGQLAGQLGQLRYGAKQSAIQNALQYAGAKNQSRQGLAGLGLNARPFGYQTTEGKNNFFDAIGYGAGSAFGKGLPGWLNGLGKQKAPGEP